MRNIGLIFSLTRHAGGTYQWAVNILSALKRYQECRDGAQVHIFYADESGELLDIRKKFSGFRYCRVGKWEIFWQKIQTRIFIRCPFLIHGLRYMYPLNNLAAKRRIDLMIFPGASFHPAFYNGRQIFMFTDIAHVFYPQFSEVSANGELRRRNLLFSYGIRQASRVVVDSNQLRRDVVKYYAGDASKIDVLYQALSKTLEPEEDSGSEVARFKSGLPEKYLFYPAQLWAHKNHRNLFLAMKTLIASDPALKLVLAGSKKEGFERILSLVKELGLEEHVIYLGYVQDKFMPVLYEKALALVMPTYFGPTNIPTLEAFYFGCPAVISDLPGVREQTGDAALLFDPDSPKDIADKIMSVIVSPAAREGMICKGRERLKILSYENYRDSFFAVLDKALVG
ncbi:MAG: glycosyltransferase family 4 protein [Candidatus Omnitrophica bacterium]|nr:glycosyltransferase family 4 protein [Candidatus Omnitrophota bacterium]